MQKSKTLVLSRLAVVVTCLVLALGVTWGVEGTAQVKPDKAQDPDSRVQQKDKQPPGDQSLASQVAELRAKVARLEAALEGSQGSGMTGMAGGGIAGGGPQGLGGGFGFGGGGVVGPPPGGGLGGIAGLGGLGGGLGGGGVQGLGGGGLGGFGGGGVQGLGGGGLGGISGLGGFGGGQFGGGFGGFGGMSGGMEDTEMMEMIGMMGMAPKSTGGVGGLKSMGKIQMEAALPGFPGASHVYHVGATDFFLNHPQHIKLTTKQQAELVRLKEKAVLAKTTAQRKIDEAEQELWTLTGADEPDMAKITAKVQEIEKLRGDQRVALIRAVGDAAKLLTGEQRQGLLGTGADKASKSDPRAGHKP
jgi:Spy/CpxP family protein refolding chaperone